MFQNHMKQLLAAEERTRPHLFKSLLSAMRPLMGDPATDERPGEQTPSAWQSDAARPPPAALTGRVERNRPW